ncbi:MAG: DUF2256 domain-containing protein [Armatimonadota bacterium]
MSKGVRNPNDLPVKRCPVCGRDFTWRKKWERDWESVVYCSDKCRSGNPKPR